MTRLLPALRAAAATRALIEDGARLDAATVFALVRDMPYRRASDREPATIIDEWQGTCSGKHYLLAELLRELGWEVSLLLATHEFTSDDLDWPPQLASLLEAGPIPDVHTFIRARHELDSPETMTIDATWPAAATALGLTVNGDFEAGRDQRIAADPIELIHLPEDVDPQEIKEDIIAEHVAGALPRREAFLETLMDWLATETPAATPKRQEV